ncbi:hypothetical protein [Rhodoplanes roseus]|uniref:hypothetical protein n=1 Tax=Rhodoplanes roseus TaxID=29409 RepID=UPI0011B776B4|nr:hypothetical protein [Rhodoplanes roseus]
MIRFILWAAGVGIASFPTFQASHSSPFWNLPLAIDTINGAGHYRDLFFVIVPAAAVPLSTTVDFICLRGRGEIDTLLAVIALLINFTVLVSGLIGFLVIPPHSGALSAIEVHTSTTLIAIGLVISVVTEVWVSGAAERRRARNPSGH